MKKRNRLNLTVAIALIFLLIFLVFVLAQKGIIPLSTSFIKAAPPMHGEIDVVCYNYKLRKEIGFKGAIVTPLDTDRDTFLDSFAVDATLDGTINDRGDFMLYVGDFDPKTVEYGRVTVPFTGVMSNRSATMISTMVEVVLHQLNSYKERISSRLNELADISRTDSVAAKVIEVEIDRLIAEEEKVTKDFNMLPHILGIKDPAISCYYLNLREVEQVVPKK